MSNHPQPVFGLFSLALQVSFLPMSFLLSHGHIPEKNEAQQSPSFWRRFPKAPRGEDLLGGGG